MKRFTKITAVILALCALCLFAVSCDQSEGEVSDEIRASDKAYYDYNNSLTDKGTDIRTMFVEREIDTMKVEDFEPTDKQSDYVLIKIKDYGSIVAVLRSDVAPITVANFKKLTKEKFFDGTVFHRVIENFMIQGGGCIVVKSEDGKTDTFESKESPSIKGEFTSNGFENNLLHVRGVLAMARTSVKDSASSQFYIVHQSSESAANLNGDYATFGYVLAGMDVVDAIATCKTFGDANAPIPIQDVVIESVTFVQPK